MDLYFYRAVIRSVYDGDTCRADIDLGLGTWIHNEKLRLARINTPEIRGAEREQGLIARDFLRAQLDGKELFLQTIKDTKGKYGRYLAELWIQTDSGAWRNLNDYLVQQGHAEYYDPNKTEPAAIPV